ncbi:hypothetical protein HMPREF9711_01678 [Myroides odoratimimus CCUG 3837]|uniref:porin family protein n=1 Tax=Myroides odoratimimus TaxID=76832 RepID=UPI000280A642|nr:porin family protein [Myroides odoratimimus]EKB04813.1 hypothetical protein HMPREF9711_01678 [Myroides odoratimimus CCUG 3837]
MNHTDTIIMKKLLLTLLLIMGISQSYAQKKQRILTAGVRGGWNFSSVVNSGGDSRTNFYVGVQLPIRLAKFYSLQPELVYSRQGADNIVDRIYYENGHGRSVDLKMGYIDINVINKFHFGRLNLQVGPGIAIQAHNNVSEMTPVDLTINLGVGIDITKRIGIEARWMPGLIGINDYYYDSDNGEMRNNILQVGAYFRF